MKTTMNIEGIMCPHCEMKVTKALAAIEGVTVESVSHDTGIAAIERTEAVADQQLIDAVTGAGYKVISVQ